MRGRVATLQAFTPELAEQAHALLAIRVAHMMGKKLEEGDWAEVYCRAKGIPLKGWSNLGIDISHEYLGVEHKMLCVSSKKDISDSCGETFMHPSATRSFRPPPKTIGANDAMRDVLTQYGDLIRARGAKVKAESGGGKTAADMRTGWLLWQESLRQFLYFEERMRIPNPDDFEAEWHENNVGKGTRKPSTNLWVFEKKTGAKKFSITTEAGGKIQPYFTVPSRRDPNLYIFTVIGEVIKVDQVRVWLTGSTVRELKRLVGDLDVQTLSKLVIDCSARVAAGGLIAEAMKQVAYPYAVTLEAYTALEFAFPGKSDEHRFQLLVEQLQEKK